MRIVFAAARVWKTWISINNRNLFNWKKWCASIILHTSKVGKNLFSYISLFGFNSFKNICPCTWRVTVCAYSVLFALQSALVFLGGLVSNTLCVCVCAVKVTKIIWKIVHIQVKSGISQLHTHCVFACLFLGIFFFLLKVPWSLIKLSCCHIVC